MQSFSVGQATTTISINNIPASPTFGGNFTPTYAYTGDGVTSTTSSTAAVCTVTGGVVNFVEAGTCSLTAHAAAGTNYAAVNGSVQSYTIGKAPATVTFNAGTLSQTYDATLKTLATTTTPAGLTVNLSFTGTPTNVGSYPVTATINDANYQGSAHDTLVIGKANQTTVTVTGPASVSYGTTGTATASGGNGTGTYGFLTSGTGCSLLLTTISVGNPSGTCSLTATRAGDNNYYASAISASFPVTLLKANQTILFAPLGTKIYGDPDFVVSATASSGLAISFDSLTTPTCTISGNTVHIVAVGTCTIRASQGGNGNYNYAPNVSQSFTVAPACVTGTAERMYIGTTFAWTSSPTGSTASLTLGAGLKACGGDIRTAKVTFAVRNADNTLTPISGATNLPVGLVNPGDTSKGTATAITKWNLGSASNTVLDIAIIVGGNFTSNSPANDGLVTVARPPGSNPILGGGSIQDGAPTDSQGYLKAANNDITQYFLNATFNKSGTNPQGKVWIQINSYNNPDGTTDTTLHTYRFSSTSIAVLAADSSKGTASFSSKGTVQDVTNPNAPPVGIDGGATLQVSITDGDKGTMANPGVGDSISFYVLKKNGGVWYANKLDNSLNAVQVPAVVPGSEMVVK